MPKKARDPLSATVTIANRRGLHARAAAKFVKTAESFDASIEVRKGDIWVTGTSIMGLMMLAAATGHEISLTAEGPGAADAIRALVELVEDKFDED
jgi:phosphocarrier protein